MTTGPSPIVLKLGGLAVEDPPRASPLLRAIVEAHRESPGGVILVHGGGAAVDAHLARLGIVSERREGLRVTTDAEIGEVVAVLAGRVNKAIVGALNALDGRAVGLALGDGGFVRARKVVPQSSEEADSESSKSRILAPPDLGRVGEVVGGDPNLLRILLAEGFMPVLAPIAFDEAGAPLNINADDAAAAVAAVVGARLLVLLTDVPGVLDASKRLIHELDAPRAGSLIATGVITGGMIPKVRSAARAAERAGIPAVIASWDEPGAIAPLLRGEPIGTRLTPTTSGAPRGAPNLIRTTRT